MDGLIIACGTTLFFGTLFLIVFGFFGYLRYLRYQETITLAEKGLIPPQSGGNGKGTLRWGIVVTSLGVALCLGLYPIGWIAAPGEFPLNFGPWMLIGLIPTFFGLGLVIVYYLTLKDQGENLQRTGDYSSRELEDSSPQE
jgi:hypothetical protein